MDRILQSLKLLVLSFFPAFNPPQSGGEVRLFNFYLNLSRYHEIMLLSPTYPERAKQLVRHSENFYELRVPKPEPFIKWHRFFDETARLGADVSGLVCALACEEDSFLAGLIAQKKAGFDAIIHESPYTVPADDDLGHDGIPRYYFSHNVEWRLPGAYYEGEWKDYYLAYIKRLEARLVRHAAAVSYTAEADAVSFKEDFFASQEKLLFLPNGIDLPGAGAGENDRPAKAREEGENELTDALSGGLGEAMPQETKPLAVFTGSEHRPNRDAVDFIVKELALQCPRWRFVIIGAAGRQVESATLPGNVELTGVVGEESKNAYYRQAVIALNPVTSGSGTNVKMLDYLAHGLPVLTTPVGARGLGLADQETALVREKKEFAGMLEQTETLPLKDIGEAGRKLVAANFSWPKIAEKAACYLAGSCRAARGNISRPGMIVLNDYPLKGKTSGGAVRIYNLFRLLADDYRIYLLGMTPGKDPFYRRLAGGFSEEVFPWPESMHQAARSYKKKGAVSVDDILAGRYGALQAELLERFKDLLARARVVVLEHCYLAPLVEKAGLPEQNGSGPLVVHEAHNCEVSLKESLLVGHPDFAALLGEVKKYEALAVETAALNLCVSEEEANKYRASYPGKRFAVVENGAVIEPVGARNDKGHLTALFIGSAHPPNVAAARFIINELAPACPEILFVIAGSCGDQFNEKRVPANVQLTGPIGPFEKRLLFKEADVGLNPVFFGGGSSLKLGEYLAAGLAVVSSHFGCRGYNLVFDYHLLVAEADSAEAFRVELLLLDRHRNLGRLIGENARRWAKKRLDWTVLAKRYRLLLAPKRLLAVTYRFTDPPRGGAERYLYELLQGLHRRHDYLVDVATIEATGNDNCYHFAGLYQKDMDYAGEPSFADRIFRASTEETAAERKLPAAKNLMELWNREAALIIEQCRDLWGCADEILLLDGWYWPEVQGSKTVRWTAPQARLYLPPGIKEIKLSCSGQQVSYRFAGKQHTKWQPVGKKPLPVPGEGGILQLKAKRHLDCGDVRELGAFVYALAFRRENSWCEVDLGEDAFCYLAREHYERWIATLTDIARQRAGEADELFLDLRGPSSGELNQWLRRRLKQYDLVIAHGSPFKLPVEAVFAAKEAGVPVVYLPHFHIEDRFYHWTPIYRAMQTADLNVIFPRRAKLLLEELLGIKAEHLAGGAVDPGEFKEVATKKDLFYQRFSGRIAKGEPFFLVLGHNRGSKQGQKVIAAHRQLQQSNFSSKLLFAGPGHEKRNVETPGVLYAEEQPRQIVTGALYACSAVVSMSESESFGLVIVEAWACGRPVLVYDGCLAFRELVENEADGLFAAGEKELAEQMAFILKYPEQAAAMGRRGQKKVYASYTWDKLIDQWAATLKGLRSSAYGG